MKHWLGKNKGEGERLRGNQQRKKVEREIRVGYIRWKKKSGKKERVGNLKFPSVQNTYACNINKNNNIMTRTCIDTIKEQVTRGLKIERELV